MTLITDEQWVETTEIYREDPVKGLAVALHFSAMEGFHGFRKLLDKEFKDDHEMASRHMANVYLEYLVLFLHLMNRTGDELIGKDYNLIQNAILPYIASYAGSYFEGDLTQLTTLVVRAANDAETEYAKCKYWISPRENDSIKAYNDLDATVVRFHRRLLHALGKDPKDFFGKMEVMASASHGEHLFFSLINLREWLKGPAEVLGIKRYKSINLKPPGVSSPQGT